MSADAPASHAAAGILPQITGRELDGLRPPLTHEADTPAADQHSNTGTTASPASLAETIERELRGPHSGISQETSTPAANQPSEAGAPSESPTSDLVAVLAQMTGHELGALRSPLTHKTGPPAADQHSDSDTTADTVTGRSTETISRKPSGIHSPLTRETWSAPGWVEALIPGRVKGYGTPEEVLRGAA
jgi:hypothetical protein